MSIRNVLVSSGVVIFLILDLRGFKDIFHCSAAGVIKL